MSLYSLDGGTSRSRSVSPYNNRNYSSTRVRTRSLSPSRRSIKTSQSVDLERRGRSRTPQGRSNLRLYNDKNYYTNDDGKSSLLFLFLYPSSSSSI